MIQSNGKLVLSSVVAAVVALGLAASIVYAFPSPNSTSTQVYPLRLSASGSGWNFTATINSSSVKAGQSILLMANLVNTYSSNQTIAPYVNPYINPSVYATNGTELWAWNPPQATWPRMIIESGQDVSGKVVIPTSQLHSGQVYLIKVVPLSTQFLSPSDFALTFQFSVH